MVGNDANTTGRNEIMTNHVCCVHWCLDIVLQVKATPVLKAGRNRIRFVFLESHSSEDLLDELGNWWNQRVSFEGSF